MSRSFFVIIALLITALAISAKSQAAEPSAGLPVEAVEVRVAPVKSELTATGTLYANEAVVIAAEIAGRVDEINFDEGKTVSAGQVLLRLDQSILTAERDRARANFTLSQANIKRAEILFGDEAISERERDEAYATWRLDEANLRLAEAQLAKTVIRAPFSGMLGLRQVSVGEYLQPGEAVVTLNDIDPIKVDFRVPEVFAHQLHTGQKIQLSVDAVPGRTFAGKVYAIDPQVDVNGRSVLLRARVEQADERPLRPGMFARINLILEERPQALMIPEEALIPRGNQQQVFTVVDGKVAAATVSTGLRTRGQVEILEGLEPGAMVITAGQIKVRPGMAVTVVPPVQPNAQSGK